MWSNIIYNKSLPKKAKKIDEWYENTYKKHIEKNEEGVTKMEKPKINERKIIVGETKTFERVKVPTNIYKATIISIDDVPEGPFGKRIAVRFEFLYENKFYNLSKFFYLKVTSKTDLGKFIKTVLGKDFVPGEELDLNILVGKQVNLLVNDFTNTDGVTFSVINHVLPLVKEGVRV